MKPAYILVDGPHSSLDRHGHLITATVEPMVALANLRDIPDPIRGIPLDEARTIARRHTMSEPWRCSAYVLYQDGVGWHREYYHWDMAMENPRPLVIEQE